MRICIIGNSHIACLKMGWDNLSSEYSDIAVDFYGARAQSLNRVHLEGRCVIPDDDGIARAFVLSSGQAYLDADLYDFIFVVGAGLSLHRVVDFYGNFRSDDHRRDGRYLLSSAAFAAAAFGLLDKTSTIHILKLLKAISAENVLVYPNPLPGEGLLGMPGRANWHQMIENDDTESILSIFEAYIENLIEQGIAIRRQPSDTLQSPIFTQSQFSAGYPAITDDVHKNCSFGRIIMRDILSSAGTDLCSHAFGEEHRSL
jgi:hypothetical protein